MMNVAITAGLLVLAAPVPSRSPAPSSGFVTTATGRLFYEVAGKGPAVILIHDGIVHRETWDEQFATFAKQFRVVRYDRPTLIVIGAEDIPDVHAHGGAIQAGIAGARRVVVGAAGHLVHMERPEEFNRIVLEFLASPPAP